jgi:hypothetical protein
MYHIILQHVNVMATPVNVMLCLAFALGVMTILKVPTVSLV